MHVNLHYLELFYYVGCHGGPARASVKMPYGIDPSAVSRQLCELDLWRRREIHEPLVSLSQDHPVTQAFRRS